MNHRLRNTVLYPDILLFLSDLTKLSSGFYSTIRTASTSSRGANYREQMTMRRFEGQSSATYCVIEVEFWVKERNVRPQRLFFCSPVQYMRVVPWNWSWTVFCLGWMLGTLGSPPWEMSLAFLIREIFIRNTNYFVSRVLCAAWWALLFWSIRDGPASAWWCNRSIKGLITNISCCFIKCIWGNFKPKLHIRTFWKHLIFQMLKPISDQIKRHGS